MNIFDLHTNWKRLDEILEETGGELTPDVEVLLGELVTASGEALERAGFYRRALETQIAVAKDRRAALAATIERAELKLARVEAALVPVLRALGKPQRFPEFTMSTMTRELVSFALKPGAEYFEIPGHFIRTRDPELDLAALKEARKAGEGLPDQILVAVSESVSVTLRTPTKKKEL